jgi:hypothetical protein
MNLLVSDRPDIIALRYDFFKFVVIRLTLSSNTLWTFVIIFTGCNFILKAQFLLVSKCSMWIHLSVSDLRISLNSNIWSFKLTYKILYRDGGTCWGITDSATHFFTLLFPDHRRYYNRYVTNGFHTQTVLTIALSRATPIPVLSRTLGAFDCRLISSARRLAADWRLQALFLTRSLCSLHYLITSKLKTSTSYLHSRTVGPKIALRRTQ